MFVVINSYIHNFIFITTNTLQWKLLKSYFWSLRQFSSRLHFKVCWSYTSLAVDLIMPLPGHNDGFVVAQEDVPSPASSILMDGLSTEDEKLLEASKESFTFQAEVNRLMDIIINSLCTLTCLKQFLPILTSLVWNRQKQRSFLERINFKCLWCIGQIAFPCSVCIRYSWRG